MLNFRFDLDTISLILFENSASKNTLKINSKIKNYMKIYSYDEFIVEQLPQQHTVDQLKSLRKITKGIDIGDRTKDAYANSANLHYNTNVVDTGIESFQDYEKSNIDWDQKNPLKNQLKNTRLSEVPQMKKKYPNEKLGQKK